MVRSIDEEYYLFLLLLKMRFQLVRYFRSA